MRGRIEETHRLQSRLDSRRSFLLPVRILWRPAAISEIARHAWSRRDSAGCRQADGAGGCAGGFGYPEPHRCAPTPILTNLYEARRSDSFEPALGSRASELDARGSRG